jgi:hypothetical protein
MLYYRMGREMFVDDTYPDMEAYYRDMGTAYHKAVSARRRRLPLSPA